MRPSLGFAAIALGHMVSDRAFAQFDHAFSIAEKIPTDQWAYLNMRNGYFNPKFTATQQRRKHLQNHFAKPKLKTPKGKRVK